jgi:glycerol-3-phosphate dehydrogenase
MPFDVVVIGAGVVGTAIARELSRYCLNIAIMDREPDFGWGATKANSAIVHAGYDDEPQTLKSHLCVRGNALFEELCRNMDVPFERNGSLVVALDSTDEKEIETLYKRGLKNGVPGIRILDRRELFEREPEINREAQSALFVPSAGITLPYELTIALAENAIANGAKAFLNTEITGVEEKEENVTLITKENKRIESRYVINAAGLYADEISHLFGHDDFYIYPRRGEYFLFDKKLAPLVKSTVFPTPTEKGKGILVTRTCENVMLIGPNSVDLKAEEKENTETTTNGLSEVFEGAKKLVPGMGRARRYVIKNFAGNRPQSSTKDFIIEQRGRLINAAGMQSPGLTAAPAIAEYVTEMLRYSIDLRKKEGFNPVRRRIKAFREMNTEERQRAIKENPLYGHIVCRCEHVSEAEIVEAIRRGARTLDGVKFRTRCSMGRCQGGFDLPFVLEILSRETVMDAKSILKNRAGSEVVKAQSKELLKEEK